MNQKTPSLGQNAEHFKTNQNDTTHETGKVGHRLSKETRIVKMATLLHQMRWADRRVTKPVSLKRILKPEDRNFTFADAPALPLSPAAAVATDIFDDQSGSPLIFLIFTFSDRLRLQERAAPWVPENKSTKSPLLLTAPPSTEVPEKKPRPCAPSPSDSSKPNSTTTLTSSSSPTPTAWTAEMPATKSASSPATSASTNTRASPPCTLSGSDSTTVWPAPWPISTPTGTTSKSSRRRGASSARRSSTSPTASTSPSSWARRPWTSTVSAPSRWASFPGTTSTRTPARPTPWPPPPSDSPPRCYPPCRRA